MTLTARPLSTFDDAVREARVVAAEHADAVDRDARFPAEALAVLRDGGALSALVPVALGGTGSSVTDVARACTVLARSCSATAMVFAMHQIQMATLVRHAASAPFFAEHLAATVTAPRLMASVTSEIGTGGDMGRSVAGLVPAGPDLVRFVKKAPTVSYGAQADDLLTTLRRDESAAPGDQVLVLSRRGQHDLESMGTWDPLGMRGTCSPGFVVTGEVPSEQVVPVPFPVLAAESMVPVSHLLWGSLWLGIAQEAFDRARSFVRAAAARDGDAGRAGHGLSEMAVQLGRLRAELQVALADFEAASLEPGRPGLSTLSAAMRINSIKVSASTTAPAVCLAALEVAGFSGYRNDTRYSVGRQLRDSLSGALMVANDRLHSSNASALLVVKDVP